MSKVTDTRTFATYDEAQDYLLTLSESGYRIIGAPGTDVWLAESDDKTVVVKAEP